MSRSARAGPRGGRRGRSGRTAGSSTAAPPSSAPPGPRRDRRARPARWRADAPADRGVVVGGDVGAGVVQDVEQAHRLGHVAGDQHGQPRAARAPAPGRPRPLELGEVLLGPQPLAPAQQRVELAVAERKVRALVEQRGAAGGRSPRAAGSPSAAGRGRGAAGEGLELRGERRSSASTKRRALGRAGARGWMEGEDRLGPAAEVGGQRGEPLDRVAGVREEHPVDRVGAAGGEEGQRVARRPRRRRSGSGRRPCRAAGPAAPTARPPGCRAR